MAEPNESQGGSSSSASPSAASPSSPDVATAVRRIEADLSTLERALEADELAETERRDLFESVAGQLQDLLAETAGGHRTIDTRSGRKVTPLDPDPDDVALEDIAHGLSNLSRFAGQGKQFYSVARHAVHVSHEVAARGGTLVAQRWGLLHDASEAYVADVPAPVKQSLPGYTHAEKRFRAAVREAFELELSSEDERLVDAVDSAVGRYELAVHFPDADHGTPELESDLARLESEVDADAKELFLERARALDIAPD